MMMRSAAVFLLCTAAGMSSAYAADEEIRCAKNGALTYLFAHGLNGSPNEWHHFVMKVRDDNKDYGIWRTQVSKLGHIKERAKELAAFMAKAAKKCGTEEKSVVAIAHSMGGLDLRNIVGSYPKERKYLKAVYTIATPHLGDPNACAAPGGAHDLCGHPDDTGKESPMKSFNSRHPSSEFKTAGIAFEAFWYECKANKPGEDGVVPVKSQKWHGADIARRDGGVGWHKVKHHSTIEASNCEDQHGCKPELCQNREIEHIMKVQAKK